MTVLFVQSRGQQNDIQFNHISLEQGLSHNLVHAIVQDRQGFMWFGTQDGLNRYDGYSFVVFKNNPRDTNSIADNNVTALCVDHAGVLWIGTSNGGLSRFDRTRGIVMRYRREENNTNAAGENSIAQIQEDQRGVLFVATLNGIIMIDSTRKISTRVLANSPGAPLKLAEISSLAVDREGYVWISREFQLLTLDPATGAVDTIATSNTEQPYTGLIEAAPGEMWASHEGIYSYNRRTKRETTPSILASWEHRLQNSERRCSMVDAKGVLWFGSDSGLLAIDRTAGTVRHYFHERTNEKSLADNSVRSIFVDWTGNMWVASYSGLNKYAPGRYGFRHYLGGVSDSVQVGWNWIRSFLELNDSTLLVGSDVGFRRIHLRTGVVAGWITRPGDVDTFGQNSVRSMLMEDSAGARILWFGTNGGGLFKYLLLPNRQLKLVVQYYTGNTNGGLVGNDISRLLRSRNGDLWIGSGSQGVTRLERSTGRFIPYRFTAGNTAGLSNYEVLSLFEDRDGAIWIGTGGGLDRFDASSGMFTHFLHVPNDSTSLSRGKVRTIIQDEAGALWLGTDTGLD